MKSVIEMAKAAKCAAGELAQAGSAQKDVALKNIAELLHTNAEEILAANKTDVENAQKSGLSKPMLERLTLTKERIASIAEGVQQVAALADPVGEIIEE